MYRQHDRIQNLEMKRLISIKNLLQIGLNYYRQNGFLKTIQAGIKYFDRNSNKIPLSFADQDLLFSTNFDDIRSKEKQEMRASSMLFDASHVEATYPHVFKSGDHFLRYAFLPSREESKGLVVLFHSHNAYLHLGPMIRWKHFDILAPWDTFGYNREGSWFWGERGNNFVEIITRELIKQYRNKTPGLPWFCTGGSMGGFASLYHGIKYQCDGIYVMMPQVDLRLKINEYGAENKNNPYSYISGNNIESVPDMFELASAQEELPPLFLVQHQYDPVNPFAEHGFRLLEIYNKKKAWYGIRVHPAIGHRGDGSQAEAELFFLHIVKKQPAKTNK